MAVLPRFLHSLPAEPYDYGYGLWRIRPGEISFLLKSYPEILWVSGSPGSFVYWVPEYDAFIAGTINQTNYREKHVVFLIKVLRMFSRVVRSLSAST
jgi:hypothetical protein